MQRRPLRTVLAVLASTGWGCAADRLSAPPGTDAPGPTAADASSPSPEPDVSAPPVPGAPDAAGADGATPDAGLALSDDFEDAAVGGPPNPALWSVVEPSCSGSGTLAVVDTQAHSGHHSVQVDGGPGYCDHVFFSNANAIKAIYPEVYARFFVRLEAALGQDHVTFLAMDDENDDGGADRMGGQDAVVIYNRQSDDATLPTLSPTGVADSVAIAPGTWTCIELHVDESAGTIDTWVDGAEVPGLVEDGTPVTNISTQWLSRSWIPDLVDFGLGWESYAGQAMTLWFDDVALATFRIGCGT